MLEYVALILLLIVLVIVFYGFIYLHELPYEAAKHRDHPQTEAIYVACWLSLFTLHAIWPIVFIWAISKPNPMKVAVAGGVPGDPEWVRKFGDFEQRLRRIEERATSAVEPTAQTGGGKKATIGKGKA